MKNKVCLITGGTSGIGMAAAIEIARQGAKVIITSRLQENGEKAVEEIIRQSHHLDVSFMIVDFESQKAIRQFVSDFSFKYPSIDILINNAGIFCDHLHFTSEKIELQFAVNYLSVFLLTNLLVNQNKIAVGARIINVTSRAHRLGKINFNDINLEKNYNGLKAYSQSKLAMVFFTYQLAEKMKSKGVTVNCVHPGGVKTGIGTKNTSGIYNFFWRLNPFLMSAQQGAEPIVQLAASAQMKNVTGKYYNRMKEVKSSPLSYNKDCSNKLWKLSEKLTGLEVEG